MDPTKQPHGISEEALRDVMRHWATGVTIASVAHEGMQHGMTVSAFTSVALTPPLVLVSLKITTRTHDLLQAAGAFGVTILASDQEETSNLFAGREPEGDSRFEGIETETLVTGSPFISGGIAMLDCRLEHSYEAGTHTLFIGEVLATKIDNGGQKQPLLYYDRSYREFKE